MSFTAAMIAVVILGACVFVLGLWLTRKHS